MAASLEARLNAMEARLAASDRSLSSSQRSSAPSGSRSGSRSGSARAPARPITSTNVMKAAPSSAKQQHRPLSAPQSSRMEQLDGEGGRGQPRHGSARRRRTPVEQSPRREDTQSLQVRRRGPAQSIPAAANGLVGPLPYISVEPPTSARGRDAPGAAGAGAGASAPDAAATRAEAAASRSTLDQRLAEVQRNQRRRELEAYMVELQEKAETGAVELPDGFFGKAGPEPEPEPEPELQPQPQPQPEPQLQPEPEPQLQPEPQPQPEPEQSLPSALLGGTMAAVADIGATALSADGAAPADMDELDRRLRALQTTQARRRGELDSYMEALQSVRTRSLFASPLNVS